MRLCAVIPAAGRGSRLGAKGPKILTAVTDDLTIWDLLWRRLTPIVDHIHVVLSPHGLPLFEAEIANKRQTQNVTTSIQSIPRGMGDAFIKCEAVWRRAESVLLIWGDQVHVSSDTLRHCARIHLAGGGQRVTLPVVSLKNPYVEYIFDTGGRLIRVLESREGDVCTPGGLGDVGTFLISSEGLGDAWRKYEALGTKGRVTGELNFLPFLVMLSLDEWSFRVVPIDNPDEARGVNSRDDLAFFQRIYRSHQQLALDASQEKKGNE